MSDSEGHFRNKERYKSDASGEAERRRKDEQDFRRMFATFVAVHL